MADLKITDRLILWVNRYSKSLMILCQDIDTEISFSDYLVWVWSSVCQINTILTQENIHSTITPDVNNESIGMSDYQLVNLLLYCIIQTQKCICKKYKNYCCVNWILNNKSVKFPNVCWNTKKYLDKNWTFDRLCLSPTVLNHCPKSVAQKAIKSCTMTYNIFNIMIKQHRDVLTVSNKLYQMMVPSMSIMIPDPYSPVNDNVTAMSTTCDLDIIFQSLKTDKTIIEQNNTKEIRSAFNLIYSVGEDA
ncbi:hypothetical protein AL387_gp182 [Salmon gill poxvirus]|uniref:Uncharacterized protein n=1 Tax=Salmon gill poxvirus TaxID=1680908 RepID=A0A0H4XWU8_9POXV|nr:hypothetical protein AL387_gp182 [Salmon gill poxvirus]AKR04306.1 hypothetical protein SGPV182 [Salmon gill poxvirus]